MFKDMTDEEFEVHHEKQKIKRAAKVKSMDIPECGGIKSWCQDFAMYEYDCSYDNAPECSECICTFVENGGRIDPRTGKRFINIKRDE